VSEAAGPHAAAIAALLLGAALASALLTALATAYARRRRLLDLPGRRRSHAQATPRGGGIGIVLVVVLAAALWWPLRSEAWALVAALVLVAGVGWIDDHGGLAARWRLLAHGVAAALWLAPLVAGFWRGACQFPLGMDCDGLHLVIAALALLVGVGLVWSINLHNFMDGINGLAACQAAFVFAVAALAFAHAGSMPRAVGSATLLAATVGFIPFNFPRASVFLGDVGSGALGLMIGIVVLLLSLAPGIAAASGLLACSGFVVDASCTLASRMLRGRRWYSAHREHLYQWLVRMGLSHARVVALYMAWNVVIVVPALLWINRPRAHAGGSGVMLGVYALGVGLWLVGKRWCLRRVASGGADATA